MLRRALIFCVLICPLAILSMGSGTLIGTVKDPAGNYIATSKVVVPGVVISITTGYFRGRFASGGFYQITASAPGFQTQTKVRDLANGAMNTIEFVLQPAR